MKYPLAFKNTLQNIDAQLDKIVKALPDLAEHQRFADHRRDAGNDSYQRTTTASAVERDARVDDSDRAAEAEYQGGAPEGTQERTAENRLDAGDNNVPTTNSDDPFPATTPDVDTDIVNNIRSASDSVKAVLATIETVD